MCACVHTLKTARTGCHMSMYATLTTQILKIPLNPSTGQVQGACNASAALLAPLTHAYHCSWVMGVLRAAAPPCHHRRYRNACTLHVCKCVHGIACQAACCGGVHVRPPNSAQSPGRQCAPCCARGTMSGPNMLCKPKEVRASQRWCSQTFAHVAEQWQCMREGSAQAGVRMGMAANWCADSTFYSGNEQK
jgi:hypothetical protein